MKKQEKGKDRNGCRSQGALGSEEDSGVLPYYFLPYSLETGPVIESTATVLWLG